MTAFGRPVAMPVYDATVHPIVRCEDTLRRMMMADAKRMKKPAAPA